MRPSFSRRVPRRLAMRSVILGVGVAVATSLTPVATGDATTLAHDLAKLRACESGGHWSANTGNGYYGAYQFARSTWHDLGYNGLPDRAAPSRQNDAALKLHSQDGWHPWPSCARREHLH